MYRSMKVAVAVPAYNESKLISKTVDQMPDYVDCIIVVNDGSTDNTLEVLTQLAKKNHRLVVLDNGKNHGVGYTVVAGLKEGVAQNMDLVAVMAGDAQCNPDCLKHMCDMLIDKKLDYVKANRFNNLEALNKMPAHRRVGNVVITIMNKFATGYYSIFDSQNGYGVFTAEILRVLPFELIGNRYDYENTLLIAMSIMNARIKDYPVPAIYGDEVSSIKLLPTVGRAIKVLTIGFWKRIYFKYVVFDFHPIALFLFTGAILLIWSVLYGLLLVYLRLARAEVPSAGTLMLVVLPFLTGLQLALTAIIIDIGMEKRS